MAVARNTDIMVVGYHGRKGTKPDPTVLGTAVQYLSLSTPTPVFILKNAIERKKKTNNAYLHALCSDGSRQSISALNIIMRIRQPQDKIAIIICEQENIDAAKVQKQIEDMLEEEECLDQSTFKVIESAQGQRSCDLIRNAVNAWTGDDYIDFIYVGNKGADYSSRDDKKYLGSVTNEIIRHTKLNCVFIP